LRADFAKVKGRGSSTAKDITGGDYLNMNENFLFAKPGGRPQGKNNEGQRGNIYRQLIAY